MAATEITGATRRILRLPAAEKPSIDDKRDEAKIRFSR
jgi:hypothetical protein